MSKKNYNLMNMPPKLFKYYKYDDKLNRKRLSGEVYLSSPLDFNDPCDCRVQPENNIDKLKGKKEDWLIGKIRELGYDCEESEKLEEDLKRKDENALKSVHTKQLEKAGILCLTSSYKDTQMWGYYADNTGICIEYDTEKFVKKLLFGVVDSMDYSLTKFLYEDKYYKLEFQERREQIARDNGEEPKVPSVMMMSREDWANKNIQESDISSGKISNIYLRTVLENGEEDRKKKVLNFVRHVFVKRFVGNKISYKPKLDDVTPTLFFDENDNGSKIKYFQKTNVWQHEKEFRIFVSLGGRKVVKMGADIIKNVYFGCDVPFEKIVEMAYMLFVKDDSRGTHELVERKCGLYKMMRLPSGELECRKVNSRSLECALKTLSSCFSRMEATHDKSADANVS